MIQIDGWSSCFSLLPPPPLPQIHSVPLERKCLNCSWRREAKKRHLYGHAVCKGVLFLYTTYIRLAQHKLYTFDYTILERLLVHREPTQQPTVCIKTWATLLGHCAAAMQPFSSKLVKLGRCFFCVY